MINPFLNFATLMWNRMAARHDLANNAWCEWANRLDKIGNDQGFRSKLAGHDVRHAVRNDVGDGYSHWINQVFAFARPSAELLAKGQDELGKVLTSQVENGNPVNFAHFCQKATEWSLFAPALNDTIARNGMDMLLSTVSGTGAAELAAAITNHRPELQHAAIEGIHKGLPELFGYAAGIASYPYVLAAMAGAPMLKAAIEANSVAQAFAGFTRDHAVGLKHSVVLEAKEKQGIVVHGVNEPHDTQPVRWALGKWLNEVIETQSGIDMRPAVIFEGLAELAARNNRQVSAVARHWQRDAHQIYMACNNALSPALRSRIETTFVAGVR